MSMWTSSPRTFCKVDGAWICAQSIEAVEQDGDHVRVYLASGHKVTVAGNADAIMRGVTKVVRGS